MFFHLVQLLNDSSKCTPEGTSSARDGTRFSYTLPCRSDCIFFAHKSRDTQLHTPRQAQQPWLHPAIQLTKVQNNNKSKCLKLITSQSDL